MKKLPSIIKYLVITTVIVVVVVLFVRGVTISGRERKLSKLYGDGYCEYNGEHPSTNELTPIDNSTCKLCKKRPAPYAELCRECAEKAHRCYKCGKKINK